MKSFISKISVFKANKNHFFSRFNRPHRQKNQHHSTSNAVKSNAMANTSTTTHNGSVINKSNTLHFTSSGFQQLSQNHYNRFMPNSSIIGNAVLTFNGKQVTASQYAMPPCNQGEPNWVPLADIQPIQRFGKTAYQAKTPSGATVYSNQSYRFTDETNRHFEIRPFALPPANKSEPFWGNSQLIDISKERRLPPSNIVKGGNELLVDSKSVFARLAEKRSQSQLQVMERPAVTSYFEFWLKYQTILTPEMNILLLRSIFADKQHPMSKNFSAEWLHAEAYSLTPKWMNPQRKENLGSGPYWANSEMMIFEYMCQYFAYHFPTVSTSIKSSLYMLLMTDLIESIDYEVHLRHGNRSLNFFHRIEPLRQLNPVIPQATDIAQLTGIALAKLSGVPPAVESVVTVNELLL
ncbi:hypothetical protein [Legionella sp. W05-934-2]|uniref:hypothetical protein n=1 Tax=Legionella sp. W05-934-2 TaxID=1198649 RepID=UPI00346341BD